MQRKQSMCVLVSVLVLFFCGVVSATAQVNTASITGTVLDPQGLGVKNATVTLTSSSTAAERTVVSDDDGHYTIVGLPPGQYKMNVETGGGLAPYLNNAIELTVGETATFNPRLELKSLEQMTSVSSEIPNIETTKTEVSQTVGERLLDNLPINGRNFTTITLINSQATRDVSPTIGPAPNSGVNVNGARGRSNMVTVDGADAVDNSINGIRATVSQEAVQEFQLILSNYNAEYGRASGGVINIVTKSGANDMHGDIFGFLRNKSFQARNAFSGQVNPVTGNLDPVKQAYTRVQAGATLGGAIKKNKTFYFLSYENTLREESGFSSIGIGNFGLQPVTLPTGGGNTLTVKLTASQASAVNALLGSGIAQLQQLGVQYGIFMGSASSVATGRIDYGAVAPATSGGLANPGPGAQFPIAVICPVGAIVGTVTCSSQPAAAGAAFSYGVAKLPASFVGVNGIRGNFPITEKTSLWSAKLDQHWTDHNYSFLRVGVSPSLVTGVETTSQNQVFGQNAASRTAVNQARDLAAVFQHTTVVSATVLNDFHFQYARRGIHYGYAKFPGGSNIGVNIPGYAYFGREPYSTVDRIERRSEFTDNVNIVKGHHAFKFGADFNLIQVRTGKVQTFELDFGGDVNFGGLSASTFGFPNSVATPGGTVVLPGTTALQSYGLGIPTSYIQGIGNSNSPFDNKVMGFFAQDSWRLNSKLTVNYGVRYDLELTPLFAPATAINAAAEKALGVLEGIPRDHNNVAPRLGIAWDPRGDGKTVIRAGYGLFYDHPLLAIAFDSTTADGGRSVQLISTGGTPSACGLVTAVCGSGLDSPTNLNGSSIFQGALNDGALPNLGYLFNEQRFDAHLANSLFANQNYLTAGFPLPILPFTLPVTRNYVYGYAQQANLTVEHALAKSWKISVGYQWTRGLHLNKPVDINSTNPQLLAQNAFNAGAAGLPVSNPLTVRAPSSNVAATSTTCGVGVIAPGALGQLFGCPAPLATLDGQFIGTPAFFNFFRPSGPNPSFAQLLAPGNLQAGYQAQVGLAQLAGYPKGFGVPVPFNSVDAQTSDGNSYYNGLTVNLTKHFSNGFELLSSYTWSHSIDDSTDLQSPLEPADSRFPFLERGNSVNDQRHRWVTSGVFQTMSRNGEGFWKHLLGDFTLAPIVEFSSGRPFNVITGEDTRLDLGASQGRPASAGATSSPYIPGVTFGVPATCLSNSGAPFSVPGVAPPAGCDGNLGRNRFRTPAFFQWDTRVSKRIPLSEHVRLDLIAEVFNLFNHTNVAAVNQLCDPLAGANCTAGQPTAASDPRQFQFALKLSF